jgi:hypothetical protein
MEISSPVDIPNLWQWNDAFLSTKRTTPTGSVDSNPGDPCGRWNEGPGAPNRDYRSTGTGSPPTYLINADGYHILRFAGAHMMECASSWDALTEGMIFAVLQKPNPGNDALWRQGGATGNVKWNQEELQETAGSDERYTIGRLQTSLFSRHLVTVYSKAGLWWYAINGIKVFETRTNPPDFPGLPRIGINTGGSSGFGHADFFTIGGYSVTPTLEEVDALHSYCLTRWAITPTPELPDYPLIVTGGWAMQLKRPNHGFTGSRTYVPTTAIPGPDDEVHVDNSGNGTVIKRAGAPDFDGPLHGDDTFTFDGGTAKVDGVDVAFPDALYEGERVDIVLRSTLGGAVEVVDSFSVREHEIFGVATFTGINGAEDITTFYGRLWARRTRFTHWLAYGEDFLLLGSGSMPVTGASDTDMPAGTRHMVQYDPIAGDAIIFSVYRVDDLGIVWSISGADAYRKAYCRCTNLEDLADFDPTELGWGQKYIPTIDWDTENPPEDISGYVVLEEDIFPVGPMVSVTPVSPDPRTSPVTSVAIVFSEEVTGFSLSDITLTLDGDSVDLSGASLSPSSGAEYSLSLEGVPQSNGSYVLTVVAADSEIEDLEGNPLEEGGSDSWVLAVVRPTVSISPVSPDPRAEPVVSVTITFSEAVTGFDIGDIRLTRDGQTVDLALASLSAVSGTEYTLDLSDVIQANGVYILTVVAEESGIEDLDGNFMEADGSDSWTLSVPEPVVEMLPEAEFPGDDAGPGGHGTQWGGSRGLRGGEDRGNILDGTSGWDAGRDFEDTMNSSSFRGKGRFAR